MQSEHAARIEKVRLICKRRGLTQAHIASELGVSQSQISRVLKGNAVKATRLSRAICLYVEKFEFGGVTPALVQANEELMNALTSTWDGSEVHAKALSTVIRSLCVLRPYREPQSTEGAQI